MYSFIQWVLIPYSPYVILIIRLSQIWQMKPLKLAPVFYDVFCSTECNSKEVEFIDLSSWLVLSIP